MKRACWVIDQVAVSGKTLDEDVVGPPGHLLGLAVERFEQRLGVGRLGAEGVEQVAGAVVGVAGLERLELDQRELEAGRRRVRVGGREVAGADQRPHCFLGHVQELSRLGQR